MGNSRDRSRKKARVTPLKKKNVFQDGGSSYKSPGPSAKKISENTAKFDRSSAGMNANLKEGTIFMDLSVLFTIFDEVLKCPECGGDMSSHVDVKKKCGFSHYIVLECQNMECEWKHCFNTSKKQGHSHEVNVRAVLAFREIGRGYNAMKTFTKVMNMPAPPARRSYTRIQNKKILPVVKQLANDSMVTNAMKVREENASDAGECGVSIDGTWQKRGHASHNGVVTVISLDSQKCLDVEVMSDKCTACLKWQKKKDDPRYEEWKASHNCKINHVGSANSMETTGAVRIFNRSLATRGLKYKKVLGDGDSSTYNAIVENKPYEMNAYRIKWSALDMSRRELVVGCGN